MVSLHLSPKDNIPIRQHVQNLTPSPDRPPITHVSIELFFEVENMWIDDIVLHHDDAAKEDQDRTATPTSPSYTLLQAVSSNCSPTLCSLQLYSTKATSAQVLPLLATIIRKSPCLSEISTTRVLQLTHAADVNCLAQAVAGHPSLTDFKLIHPQLGPCRRQQRQSKRCKATLPALDALVLALATAPNLTMLDITLYWSSCSSSSSSSLETAPNIEPHPVPYSSRSSPSSETTKSSASAFPPSFLSVPTLSCLLQNARHLTTLSLWGCGLHNGHVVALSSSAQQLQFLSLRRNPAITHWAPLYQSLVHDNYHLQALYNDDDDDGDADDDEGDHHDDSDDIMMLPAALPADSGPAKKPPTTSLRRRQRQAAALCLALNRCGRRQALCDADPSAWLDLVADFAVVDPATTTAVNAMYHLVRSRPSMVAYARKEEENASSLVAP